MILEGWWPYNLGPHTPIFKAGGCLIEVTSDTGSTVVKFIFQLTVPKSSDILASQVVSIVNHLTTKFCWRAAQEYMLGMGFSGFIIRSGTVCTPSSLMALVTSHWKDI